MDASGMRNAKPVPEMVDHPYPKEIATYKNKNDPSLAKPGDLW
jgi:hypothetical protein